MTAHFNHTIIASTDPAAMAAFYRDLLEADEQPSWGPFTNLTIGGGVLLQFATPPVEFPPSTTRTCSTTSTSTGRTPGSRPRPGSTGPIPSRPGPVR